MAVVDIEMYGKSKISRIYHKIKYWAISFYHQWKRRVNNTPFRLRKAWNFMKLGWQDYDWDYGFLLYLEQEKLKSMHRYFSKSPIAENDWAVARDTKICVRLLDIIMDQDSSYVMKHDENKPPMEWDLVEIKRVNLRNAKRFLSEEEINGFSDKPRMRIYLKDDLRKEKAWSLYCKIRENNMRSWWN